MKEGFSQSNPSVKELLAEGSAALQASDIDAPRKTAALLIRETLKIDLATLIAHPEKRTTPKEAADVRAALARRASGEPLQYITGVQEFYGLEFQVTPAVLIPRPETELLVDAALRFCRERGLDAPRLLDVGCGSGCISVTLVVNMPHALATATDISPHALAVARANAARHGALERIRFLESDFLSAPLPLAEAQLFYHLIVSNPPYVSEADFPALQREVRDFEPKIALIGGKTGTEMYERLFKEAQFALTPNGIIICEIGFGQLESVSQIGEALGWVRRDVTVDLQGVPRALTFRRASLQE